MERSRSRVLVGYDVSVHGLSRLHALVVLGVVRGLSRLRLLVGTVRCAWARELDPPGSAGRRIPACGRVAVREPARALLQRAPGHGRQDPDVTCGAGLPELR